MLETHGWTNVVNLSFTPRSGCVDERAAMGEERGNELKGNSSRLEE